MALVQATSSAMELAKSLSEEEVPVKLRCAICNRLAINAFRLPCCEQNICQTCQSSLPQSCPVCDHSPLTAEAAKPLKSLRLTVQAFIKNIEKKREKERAGASADTPVTPITPVAPPTPVTASAPASAENTQKVDHHPAESDAAGDPGRPLVHLMKVNEGAVPEQAAEETEAQHGQDPSSEDKGDEDDDTRSQASDETQIVTGDERQTGPDGQLLTGNTGHMGEQSGQAGMDWNAANGQGQGQDQMFGGGFGFNAAQAGFPGMDWNNPEFAQMMQMQMQNGTWGGFPNMMGMSGMGMNSMDMSGMFGGYGMQGMGAMNPNMMSMSGMNGMMGMDFSAGYGGWNNGQQMNGDFGASSGYYPAGGYNQSHQGQFPQMSQHQQYPKNNYHNQNRFHGSQRGYGRGFHNQGHGQFHNHNLSQAGGPPPGAPTGPKAALAHQGNEEAFHHQLPTALPGRRPSQAPSVEQQPATDQALADMATKHGDVQETTSTMNASGPAVTEEASINPLGNINDKLTKQEPESNAEASSKDIADSHIANGSISSKERYHSQDVDQSGPSAPVLGPASGFDTFDSTNLTNQMNDMPENGQQMSYSQTFDQSYEAGVSPVLPHPGRGGFRGRGGHGFRGRASIGLHNHNTRGPEIQQISEPKGVGVQGAPTGPKAMREGLPNTGWSGRGRGGFGIPGRGGSASVSSGPPATSSDTAISKHEKTSSDRAKSRSRSKSHSRSQSQSRRHHRRHRSRTPSSDSEYERRRERRRRRSSRYHEDEETDTPADDTRDREDEAQPRSREGSVDDKHRSGKRDKDRHRPSKSHRDSSRDRRRHRRRSRSGSPDDADEVDGAGLLNGNDKKSEEKEQKRHKDKYRDRSRDRDRDKDRYRDRDRDKKRSRRERSESRESDRHHRSSRRSRREREKDRDRERDRSRERDSREETSSAKPSHPPTPVEPEAEFKIQGRSKDRTRPLPTGPAAMQPPTGPRAQIKMNLGNLVTKQPPGAPKSATPSRRPSQPPTPTSAVVSTTATPTASTPTDPYEEERRKAYEERLRREELRRKASTSSIEKKRSWTDANEESSFAPPAGPKGDRRGKGARDAGEGRSRKSRRMSYKYEDEENDEQRATRVESEREAARWN